MGGTCRSSALAVLRLNQFELGRLLHRKLCRLGTLQNAIDIRGESWFEGIIDTV